MNNLSKHFSKLVLIFGIILLLFVVFMNSQNVQQEEALPAFEETTQNEELEEKMINDEKVGQEIESIIYIVKQDEKNAFELLKENESIEYKEYDFGVFIESINGIAGNENNFWALYVNDEKAITGADQIFLNAGDTVEWRYEKITY